MAADDAHHQPRAGAGVAEIERFARARAARRGRARGSASGPAPGARSPRPAPRRPCRCARRRRPRAAPRPSVSPQASRPKMKARWEIDLSPGGRNRPLSAGPRIARRGEAEAGCGEGADTRELACWRWRRSRGRPRPYHRRWEPVDGRGNRIDKGQGTRLTGALRKPPFNDREPIAVAKPELGAKRQCQACGAKFFDLNKDPIVCPKCGTVFQGAAARPRGAEGRRGGRGARRAGRRRRRVARRGRGGRGEGRRNGGRRHRRRGRAPTPRTIPSSRRRRRTTTTSPT